MFAISPTMINVDIPVFIQIRSPASCNYQATRRLTVSYYVQTSLTGDSHQERLERGKGAKGEGREGKCELALMHR